MIINKYILDIYIYRYNPLKKDVYICVCVCVRGYVCVSVFKVWRVNYRHFLIISLTHCTLFVSCFVYRGERSNCRPRKDDMIPIPFNENQFSFFFFFFVADHQLVGPLCTNPKSDRSLLSCLKVTQCSTSEIGDAPLYNSCSLPIQVLTTGPLPAPSKCKSGLPRITGMCPGWRK